MAVSYGTITLSSIQDGSKWYSGTAITGTSTTATVFSGTGITSAVVGDMYLNTTTFNTYRCTVPGAANVAKWVYVNNIKGGTGSTGKGVSAIVAEYYLSTSDSQQSGGSWSTTPQAYVTGRYYWRRDKVTWTDSTTTYTSAVLDNALTSSNSTAASAKTTAENAKSTVEEFVNPIASKTYTGLIGSSNDWSGATWWFAKVHPSSYNEIWSIRCKIYAEVPNYPAFQQTIDITIRGFQNTFLSYDSNVARGGSLAMYHVNLYRATQAGITAGKGHALGFGLRASSSPTDSTYARTIKVDVIECDSCTVTMIDPAVKYANMDGTGSTNYYGLTELYVGGNGQNATNNTNTHYTQYANAVKAGAFGVKRYTLLMKQTADTWSSFVNQANTTATTKTVSTAGYILDKLVYSAGGAEYTSGNATSTIYDAYPIDMRYSINCGTTLTANKSIYLVGTVKSDGLFYFDTTQWYTQTQPTSVDNKVYIYIGETYSSYQAWLATENPAYIFYNGKFMLYSDYVTQKDLDTFQVESQSALDWYAANGNTVVNATTMLAKWADGAFSATTEINGGMIKSHTIQAKHLATDAIMSNNYQASSNSSSPYSATGTFLDLTTGNLYMPNFGVDNVYGKAYLNGEIVATGGRLGVDGSQNYWEIDTTKTDYNANNFASIVGHGNAFIQVGQFQLSDNLLDTRSYDAQAKITYPKYDNTYWDFGVQAPTLDTATSGYVQGVDDNFLYIRNHASTIPSLKTDWDYLFRVDKSGNLYTTGQIYIDGHSLDEIYASQGSGSAYIAKNPTGTWDNTINGNLKVTGSIDGTATKATQLTHTLSINGKSWSGSANLDVSTIGVAYGGTGATTFTSGAALIGNGSGAIQTRAITNNGSATYISGSTNLITANTLKYFNGAYDSSHNSNIEYVKQGLLGDVVTHDIDEFITVNGGIIDGSLSVTDLTAGNLVVTGVGRFTNGIYGDLAGNASTADKVNHDLVIQLNGGSTEGTNKFTFNGSAAKTVNVTPSAIGLGNVNNTADSAKNVLTATKFSSARTIALTGDVTGSASADGSSGWSIATTVKDDSHNHTWNTILPIQSKTYTGVLGTANNWTDTTFFYGKIVPSDFTSAWRIKYRIHTYVPGKDGYDMKADVMISGYKDVIASYSSMNTVAQYYPAYYHVVYRGTQAGITNGYGHALGVRLQSSYNPTATGYERTIVIELIEVTNCTFTFFDNVMKYTAIPGTGSTNYVGYTEINYVSNGLQETGDSNTVDNGSIYFSAKTGEKGIWAGSLFMQTGDGKYEGICTASDGTITNNNRTVATTKKANTTGFKVGGKIYYSTTNYNANTNISGWLVVYTTYSTFDSRYAINSELTNNFLTPYAPIYLVGTINNDGLFYLDSTWWTQTPNEENKVYVLIGGVYDSTTSYCRITLYEHNPWYVYDGSKLVEYVSKAIVADSATKLTTTRSFTVGKTAKNVDWSSAVSFSKTEISDNASGSAAGWMSSAHYTKLEGIEAGAQVNTITGVKGNSESSYRTGNVNITAANIGLGNLTNDKQVKGLANGTTAGHFVTWGANGYTVADSGYTAGQIVKTLASNNDGKIVLTYLDGTTSDPIEVKIIGSSGSSVSYADALNVNGTAVGSASKPVFINAQGKPQAANTIPTVTLNGSGTTSASFYAPTTVGTNGQYLKSNGSGAPIWATFSKSTVGLGNVDNTADADKSVKSATKATQDSDGNVINTTYLKKSGGVLTVADGVFITAPVGTVIKSHAGSIMQSPIPKYLWHDVWGFCKATTPKYYTTTDGTTWIEATLEKRLFAHIENWGGYNIIEVDGKSGSRWEWDGGVFGYCMGAWLVIGVAYSSTIAKFNVLLEQSKGTGESAEWETLCESNNISANTEPIWIKTNGSNKDNIRLTITRNAESSTSTNLPVVAIRWLTSRWGNQGKGSEFEYPYSWDGEGNIIAKGTFTGTFNGNATTATSATKATQDASGNTITSTYAKLSGATFTGAVNFANGTLNKIGDDCYLGDQNVSGCICIKGVNGATGINFMPYSGSTAQKISIDGAGTMTITGTVAGTFSGNLSGNATTATTATSVATSAGTTNVNRHVWFSDSSTETKRAHDDDFMYNPSTNTLTVANVNGSATSSFYPKIVATNEIRFDAATKPSSTRTLIIGHKWSDGTLDAKIDGYEFRNGNGEKANVTAATFYGSLSGNASSATKATNDSDNNAINTTYAKKSGAAFTGAVTGTSFGASSYLAANTGNSSTVGGIALYSTTVTDYGIAMRGTGNGGKHGYVQGDWATYNYMTASANVVNRGWVWNYKNTAMHSVASLSGEGNMVLNGSVTVGGNATNTSGCRLEYNATLDCLEFKFAS